MGEGWHLKCFSRGTHCGIANITPATRSSRGAPGIQKHRKPWDFCGKGQHIMEGPGLLPPVSLSEEGLIFRQPSDLSMFAFLL